MLTYFSEFSEKKRTRLIEHALYDTLSFSHFYFSTFVRKKG